MNKFDKLFKLNTISFEVAGFFLNVKNFREHLNVKKYLQKNRELKKIQKGV